jgi:hypothetical protein
MDECGCSGSPDICFVVETKSGEKVVIAAWERTCKGCDTPPFVMAGVISQEEYDDIWHEYKIYKNPPMNGDAFAFLENAIKMEEVMVEALDHVLVEHIHDREQCDEIFTKKGTLRAKWKKMEVEL